MSSYKAFECISFFNQQGKTITQEVQLNIVCSNHAMKQDNIIAMNLFLELFLMFSADKPKTENRDPGHCLFLEMFLYQSSYRSIDNILTFFSFLCRFTTGFEIIMLTVLCNKMWPFMDLRIAFFDGKRVICVFFF